MEGKTIFKRPAVKDYHYDVEDFLPLLTYDHGNKSALDTNIQELIKRLNARPTKAQSDKSFSIPANFLIEEAYEELGPALILWLRLVIEQQARRRKVRETDTTIATWLNTSRATVSKYKAVLKDLGFINTDTRRKLQRLSVNFFPR